MRDDLPKYLRFPIGVFLIAAAQIACAATTTPLLQWQAPTTNQDGTPLTDLAGYRIYLGLTEPLDNWTPSNHGYDEVIDFDFPTVTNTSASLTVPDSMAGQRIPVFATITAIDANGNEGDFGRSLDDASRRYTIREVMVNLNDPAPGEPTGVALDFELQCETSQPEVRCSIVVFD